MAQNNKLKRRAQAFAAKHDVSYTVALRAVDEPLHELRDLLSGSESEERYGGARAFRVVPRQGSYGAAYELNGFDTAKKLGLPTMRNAMAFLEELVNRHRRLDTAEVGTIWQYRELHRAGLLPPEAEPMEPLLYYYEFTLGSDRAPLDSWQSTTAGIYRANLTDFLGIYEDSGFIPATPQQLNDLYAGIPAGDFEAPLQISDSVPRKHWTDSYAVKAVSKAEMSFNRPRLTIFFKRNLEALHEELRSRDLDPLNFDFSDVSKDEIELSGFSTWITVTHGAEVTSGRCQNTLLWD